VRPRIGIRAGLASLLAILTLSLCLASSAAAFQILTNHKGGKRGGYQSAVAKDKGRIVLIFGLIKHGGPYRLCVDDPDGNTVCHRFQLRFGEQSGAFVSFIVWSKRFPTQVDGVYRASWFKGGQRFGPKLSFSKPA
jgi:hypothetical protein